MGFVPHEIGKDRLGAYLARNSTSWAQCVPSSTIPDNQTIVLLHWVRFDGASVITYERSGMALYDAASVNYFTLEGITGTPNSFTIYWKKNGGASQSLATGSLPRETDILVARVMDRDNNMVEAWVDGIKIANTAIVNNPTFAAACGFYLDNLSTQQHKGHTTWRASVLSLTVGQTPTAAQWAEYLRYMRDPDAPIHPGLLARVGAMYSDYRPGKGIYGATTIADQGTSGNTLTWQGGVTVQTVRTRARTPWRVPRRTWYAVKPGYLATTGATDFGFALQPVVWRVPLGRMTARAGTNDLVSISTGGNVMGIRVYRYLAYGTTVIVRVAASNNNIYLRDSVNDLDGGDLFVVCNGTSTKAYYSGQHVGSVTTAAAVNLSGNCNCVIAGDPALNDSACRIAAWNPATVPVTLEDEIRACVNNPELDPPSLTNKRVDFPLNSALLPIGTETTVANQGLGGGTLTLSAARSTSCGVMLTGSNP